MPRVGTSTGRERLLSEGHDELRLSRALEEVVEPHHGRDDRRRIVAGNRAERGDDALEAGVDRLEAIAGGAAEDDPDVPLQLVLRHDDLVDTVTVEIDRDRHRLEVVEV